MSVADADDSDQPYIEVDPAVLQAAANTPEPEGDDDQ
jgi:hypothetical protein